MLSTRRVIASFLKFALACGALVGIGLSAATPEDSGTPPPAVGAVAPDFTLQTLEGKSVTLSKINATQPVVLVQLRGWPGYQCPICSRQVHDYVAHAAEFKARGVQVVMVYPGPADQLKAHAEEFLADKSWPADWSFVIDPDYSFVNAYHLRWNAPKETAYPSLFILDAGGKIRFERVSKTHGGRVNAPDALAALP